MFTGKGTVNMASGWDPKKKLQGTSPVVAKSVASSLGQVSLKYLQSIIQDSVATTVKAEITTAVQSAVSAAVEPI